MSQAINLPLLYTNNLKIAWLSNTTLSVTSGQGRDSANTADQVLPSGVVLDFGVNGRNGLDTGVLEASKWYYIYEASSAQNIVPVCMLASLSATAPVKPQDYTTVTLRGVWRSDASVHLIKGYVVGNGNLRQHVYDDAIKVLNDGTSATLALVDLDTAVPPIQDTLVQIQDEFTPATAGDYVSYVPGDSTATVGQRTYGSVAAKANGGFHEVLSRLSSSKAQIKYINSAASGNLDLWIAGFKYFI